MCPSMIRFVSTISYNSCVGISPNLQLKCSWGQTWIDYILRPRSRSAKFSAKAHWLHSCRACLSQLLIMIRSLIIPCDHIQSKTRLIVIMSLIATLGIIYSSLQNHVELSEYQLSLSAAQGLLLHTNTSGHVFHVNWIDWLFTGCLWCTLVAVSIMNSNEAWSLVWCTAISCAVIHSLSPCGVLQYCIVRV